jgi:type III restriction enzyme
MYSRFVNCVPSGGKTSKLQEVGRGLRLPVNEFMQRVKNENFQLHYYVDFRKRFCKRVG